MINTALSKIGAVLLLICVSTSGLAQTSKRSGLPVDIRDVVNRPTPEFNRSVIVNPDSSFYRNNGTFAATGARRNLIENAARGVGIRAGFAAEAKQINAIVMQRWRRTLDNHYRFGPLLLQQGVVVPPVITRIREVRELPGSRLLYSAQIQYEIVKEPRLTTTPPSWMDYILLPVSGVRPPANVSFENEAEKDLWRSAAQAGWDQGVREARFAFVDSFNVLARDYKGMQLYHKLARSGFVSIPRVDISRQATRIDENGRRAFVNETAVRLVAGSRFKMGK